MGRISKAENTDSRYSNYSFIKASDVVRKALEEIKNAGNDKDDVNTLLTGYGKLDEHTGGFRPGELVVIASRPYMGKTNFALNIVHDQAIINKKKIAFISFAERKEDVLKRFLAMDSYTDTGSLRTGNLREPEWDELNRSADKIGKSGLILCDDPEIDPKDLCNTCRDLKSEYGIEGLVIDYIQLMLGNGVEETDHRHCLKVLRMLKRAAEESEIPIVILSQLSRNVDGRPDKRPMLTDFIEGSVIADIADTVLFIYRDDYYHPDAVNKNIAQIIIAKHREGKIGSIYLGWRPEFLRYLSIDEDDIDTSVNLYRYIDEELPFA